MTVTTTTTKETTTMNNVTVHLQIARWRLSHEIDIEHDPEAAAFVESVNGGNQTVPTVVFADGTAMTNPTAKQVKEKLGL